jgi:tRNA-specific 2-thiouridylase
MDKVVLGLSGGVDSAVSAALLKKAGYEVHGLYMDTAGQKARQDARDTAEFLGIPLTVLDIGEALEENVCAPFAAGYLHGVTPNPCVLCNPSVKFPSLLHMADELGAKYVATGHYARAENGRLYKGMPSNDQSYMLCRLTEDTLNRVLFPLGAFEKTAVRAMAAEMGIPVAAKKDSMEICFIPDHDYAGWLARRGVQPPPGNYVWNGTAVGRHGGIHRCTVGQRVPGLFDGKKLYISAIDPDTNDVTLSENQELFKSVVIARDFSWINGAPEGEISASVRVRHTKVDTPCSAHAENGGAVINCRVPVRAPSRGQSAVLYDGDRVLGGGFIE